VVGKAEIEELFAPFGPVNVSRMFGGLGVYADGVFFALTYRNEVYLKTDDQTVGKFRAAGSKPFEFQMKRGLMVTSYWSLPASAHEDEAELVAWARLALETARRAAAKKPTRKPAGKTAVRKR